MPALEMCVMCVKNFHMPSTGPAVGLRTQPLRGVYVWVRVGCAVRAGGPRAPRGAARARARGGAAISRSSV